MKQLGIGRSSPLSAQLMLIVLFCGSGCNSTSSAHQQCPLPNSTNNHNYLSYLLVLLTSELNFSSTRFLVRSNQ